MVIRIKLTVGFAAGFAYCLIPAGFLTTGMIGDHLSAEVADMILIRILVVGDRLSAIVADMVIVRVCVIGDCLSAEVTDVILIRILMVGDYISAVLPALSVTTIFCSPSAGARVKLPLSSSVNFFPFTVTVSTYFSSTVTVCASQ